jgi:DNA-binding MarR family transcriptional regulator
MIIVGVPETITPAIASLVLDELTPLLNSAKSAWAARCQERGLSMTHFQVLAHLDRSGSVPMGSIADALGVSLSNTTGIVSRMEERGVVERVHDQDDRRRVIVRMTDAGREVMQELGDLRRQHLTTIIEALPPESQENLLRAIRDVRAAISTRSQKRITT